MKINFTHFLTFILILSLHFAEAQTNQYLHFDRVDDFVQLDNGSALVANSDQISMAGWFYTDQLAYGQGMMSIRAGGAGTGEMYLIQLSDGILECRIVTTDGFHEYVAPAFTIIPETWQHIAWIYNGSSIDLYINGVHHGGVPCTGVLTTTSKPFTIGKTLLGGFNFVFGGGADEVSLWSKALTAEDLQEMMANELNGDEEGLEVYYKFNQGVPGEDNTSILQLENTVEIANGDASLVNFALNGPTSNFLGELDVSFQAITFPQIPNKLISDDPFQITATSSSGLPVTLEIVSGPATINGDIITLDGTPGEVTVKASQPGDGTFDPATDLFNSFQVIDPNENVPNIDARSPLAGDVYVPDLKPIQLAAIANIEYPELFSVADLKFQINGDEIAPKDWGNEHYTAWWTPPAYGNYDLQIISTNNYGASSIETVSINVVDQVDEQFVLAVDEVWADINNGVVEVEAELPSYTGAFENITGFLNIDCPPGGCDPWDRISGLEVKGHNGEWYEIIRYITPYGVGCAHSIDLTDFMSALQGKIRFRVYLGTLGNGFLYSLNLEYTPGTPSYPFSTITEIWRQTYDFGNPDNLQPVPQTTYSFPENAQAATLKLVSTGHGWGDNNTGNAAEFHEDTHHIWVDGTQTFEQHNWMDCNPNPDGCSPQNGTWFFDRAGWCPGSIAPWFDYNMTPYIANGNAQLDYVFDEDYVDLCHPNNPDCVNGVTCPDCGSGFNPHLIVSSYIITLGDAPIEGSGTTGLEDLEANNLAFQVYPNPATDFLNIQLNEAIGTGVLKIYNNLGQLLRMVEMDFTTLKNTIDISNLSKGIYMVEVTAEEKTGTRKIVVE